MKKEKMDFKKEARKLASVLLISDGSVNNYLSKLKSDIEQMGGYAEIYKGDQKSLLSYSKKKNFLFIAKVGEEQQKKNQVVSLSIINAKDENVMKYQDFIKSVSAFTSALGLMTGFSEDIAKFAMGK